MNKFWEFKAAAEKKGELYLYGEISDVSWWGDEVTPAQFQKDLAALGDIDALDVYINSPGGDFFAGMAIYNMLKRHEAKVTVHVDGIAASAASLIAMSGDKIVMPKNATMMIHNSWALTAADKTKMRKLADELERIDGQQAGIYSSRTGKKEAEILAWMDSERWMSGEEAVKDGFADELEPNKKIAACADAEKYFARYLHPPTQPEPTNPEAADKGGFFTPVHGADNPQPVADKTSDPMATQRKHFNDIKRKLLEV